jgi:hypothetical protein
MPNLGAYSGVCIGSLCASASHHLFHNLIPALPRSYLYNSVRLDVNILQAITYLASRDTVVKSKCIVNQRSRLACAFPF